ncbi:MAG: hypothetical protein IKU23_02140 [Clostridia bacterium]|nr:hypothetical protein [Clostridia bacterium]MBR5278046.1 hypothetical protein [Clostridia bacterium]
MKKFKSILGISLLVQSVTFFILCAVNLEKRKSLAKACGIFAVIGGVAGATLLITEYKKRKNAQEEIDLSDEYFDELFDEYDDQELLEEEDIDCAFAADA